MINANMNAINIVEAKEIIKATAAHYWANPKIKPSARSIPYMVSEPGLGKTAIGEEAAEDFEVPFFSVIPAQYDPAELGGIPYLKGEEATRARPSWMPPVGIGRCILLIDEVTQALVSGQNVIAQLVNEHRIGMHKLDPEVILIVASNHMKHRAGTQPMPAHLKDRLMFLEIHCDQEVTLTYMMKHGFNHHVISYLKNNPHCISEFDPNADACPSPRGWSRVNTVLDISRGLPKKLQMSQIAGQIGAKGAADFAAHLSVVDEMIDPREALANPEGCDIPKKGNITYMLACALGSICEDKNIGNMITYLNRCSSKEFVTFALRNAIVRTGGSKKSPFMKNKFVLKQLEGETFELMVG